jgi:hypothetical protein
MASGPSFLYVARVDLGSLLREMGGRGERPLSLADLIEKKTVATDLAAWLVWQVSNGASYIVGARRRAVGKTTTVNALLPFVPPERTFVEALPENVGAIEKKKACVVAHELSDHRREWYLWDRDLRDFLSLTGKGHMIATNMHADTFEEVHDDICARNDVPDELFRAVRLLLFLGSEGEPGDERRFVRAVYHSDGTASHRRVYAHGDGFAADAPRDAAREARCRAFLEEVLAGPERTNVGIRRLFTARTRG